MIDGARSAVLLLATVVGSGWGALRAINDAFLNPLHDLSTAIQSVKSEQSVISRVQKEMLQDHSDNKMHVILMQQRTSQYNDDIKEIKKGQVEANKELQDINSRLNLHLIETGRKK